jgi:hypothetical protein
MVQHRPKNLPAIVHQPRSNQAFERNILQYLVSLDARFRFADWQGFFALSIERLDSRGIGLPGNRRTRIVYE